MMKEKKTIKVKSQLNFYVLIIIKDEREKNDKKSQLNFYCLIIIIIV